MALAKDDAIFMHCLPADRGDEARLRSHRRAAERHLGRSKRTACTRRRRCWRGCSNSSERIRWRDQAAVRPTMRSSGPSPPGTAGARLRMVRSRWHASQADGRMPGIDLARGSAVVGMFAAYMLPLPPLMWTEQLDVAGRRRRALIHSVRRAGGRLHRAVFRGSITDPAQESGDRANQDGRACRIYLAAWHRSRTDACAVYVILPRVLPLFLLAIPRARRGHQRCSERLRRSH